jgi:hypothetical protein
MISVTIGFLMGACGCAPRHRRDLVDPYQHNFDCQIKWCQPERRK